MEYAESGPTQKAMYKCHDSDCVDMCLNAVMEELNLSD